VAEDLFDNTNSAFITLKDLKGCLIGYLPFEVDEIPTKTRNADPKKQTFKLYKSHVVVLDGKPAESADIGSLPAILEDFGLSGAFNEKLLKDAMKKGRPKVARVVVEKNTAGTESAKLVEASDADMDLAAKHGDLFREIIKLASPFDTEPTH
jgi:hypothetical protein